VRRAGAPPDFRDVEPLLVKVAFLLRDEEHGVIAAHDVIELDRDLVGGQRCGAGHGGEDDSKRDDLHGTPLVFRRYPAEWIGSNFGAHGTRTCSANSMM